MTSIDKDLAKKIALKLSLILTATVLITWVMPRQGGETLLFEEGRPWRYGSLIADFDFPVMKSDKTVKAEQDSVMRNYVPYFVTDNVVENKQTARLREDLRENLQGLSGYYLNLIVEAIHGIYRQGIVSAEDQTMLQKDSIRLIRLINGKEATTVQTHTLRTPLEAYEAIFQDPTLGQKRAALSKCNLNEYLEPNIRYDTERSDVSRREILATVPKASGVVMSGQKIIDRGEIVDEETYRILTSYERELGKRKGTSVQQHNTLVGQVLFVFIMIACFTLYLEIFRKDYFDKPRSLLMVYALIILFPMTCSVMVAHHFFSIYILPFAMLPVLVRVFLDSRTAFMAHIAMILLCSCVLRYQYEFITVQTVAGFVAISSLRDLSSRSQLFRTAFNVTLAMIVTLLSLELIHGADWTHLDFSTFTYFIVAGVLLAFSYGPMFLIEKFFGFTSNVTLVELSDTNNELIRRMSEVAPGTFQHSIQVGNLAAEVANKIGAKAQLVRTGALYHDIGKIMNPAFFTENQKGVNPHDKMSPIDSAHIIINHVPDGVKLADKYRIPKAIKDFITTHHGRSKAKFFYITYKNQHPNEPVDEELFTYPGPNPQTREQAILMMADSVEAASRSLTEYTEESIKELVDRIIDAQFDNGYFRYCPITFRDIVTAKGVFVEKLKIIYHTRIKYPELNNAPEA